MAGRTLRETIALALESLSGDLVEWAVLDVESMRDHVVWFVTDYASRRGLDISRGEIEGELRVMIRDIRTGSRSDLQALVPVPNEAELPYCCPACGWVGRRLLAAVSCPRCRAPARSY